MNSKFKVVCCLHGDEPFPLYAALEHGVSPIIGNTAAFVAAKRFIDKDLNASFGERGNTLEHRRARELLTLIPQSSLVLDFHTFSCASEPFCIVVNESMLPLARRTGIRHIVMMRYNIKDGHALIDHCPGISIEVGAHTDYLSYETTINVLDNIETGTECRDALIYESIGTIETPCRFPNLAPTPEGWIPLLAGERAYKHHGIKVVPIA